ncbi:MAG: hypothetical protein U1F35_21045 [Steroidobacteraceae bacterium]
MPPKALETLSEALCQHLVKSIDEAEHPHGEVRPSTPRRSGWLCGWRILPTGSPIERRAARTAAERGVRLPAHRPERWPSRAAAASRWTHSSWKTDKARVAEYSMERGAETTSLLPGSATAALAALPIPEAHALGREHGRVRAAGALGGDAVRRVGGAGAGAGPVDQPITYDAASTHRSRSPSPVPRTTRRRWKKPR